MISTFAYDSDDPDGTKNVNIDIDHKKKIKEISDEFDHMIKFMDFSFEKAFDKKEKDFMLAYRVNITESNLSVFRTI